MRERRVVVTGIGVVCPVGNNQEEVWAAVRDGRSGIAHISSFDTSEFDVQIAGEVKHFDSLQYVSKREGRRLDRFTLFAIAAAEEALNNSGLMQDRVDPTRVGVFVGTGIGGLHEIEAQHSKLMAAGPRKTSPLMIPKLMTNAAAGQISIRYGFLGPSMSISSACASGSNAIGEAFHSIRERMVDVQICGGSEAAVTPMGLSGFAQMKALSTRNNEPQKASRPFEKNRDGFVMGEGAGILVLESLEHAKARGATIMAEIVGYGASSDASHITLPEPEGKGAVAAMRNALKDAALAPEAISYINAHGTATPAGDDIEAKAICRVFGDHAWKVAVSSSKSMFGHLLGASGAVESAVCIWAIMNDICPPTINLDEPDPQCCGLNFVPHQLEERPVNAVLNNSFGFGGHNVCLVFREFDG